MTEGGDFDKLGRGAIWTGEIEPCLHQNHVFAVRCDRSKVLPEWVSWISSSHYGRRYFLLCSKQSTNLASINSSQLKAFPLPLPSIAEQELMAAAVHAVEKQAVAVSKLISAKRTLKRGLIQRILTGHMRFPEFRESSWRSSRLGDHVSEVFRRNTSGVTLVLTASGEHGLVDQRRYFNRNVAGLDLSRYLLLRKGEFAYNRSAMNGYPFGATKRLEEHEEGALSTLYLCFEIKDSQLDSDYLKHVFDSGVLNRQLRPIVRVGGRRTWAVECFGRRLLFNSHSVPEHEEQRQIADLLNMLDRELDLLAERKGNRSESKSVLSYPVFLLANSPFRCHEHGPAKHPSFHRGSSVPAAGAAPAAEAGLGAADARRCSTSEERKTIRSIASVDPR